MPKTHNGKIGRLPKPIRDALNRRLDNSEPAPPLLAWLDGLPEVQAVLNQQFDGKPINEEEHQIRKQTEQRRRARKPLFARLQADDLAQALGGTEEARKFANDFTETQHDLPLGSLSTAPKSSADGSTMSPPSTLNQQKVNQGESR